MGTFCWCNASGKSNLNQLSRLSVFQLLSVSENPYNSETLWIFFETSWIFFLISVPIQINTVKIKDLDFGLAKNVFFALGQAGSKNI